MNDDILEDSNELELVTSSEAIVADQPSLTPSGPSLTSSDAPLTTSHLTPATLGGAPKKMEFRHLVSISKIFLSYFYIIFILFIYYFYTVFL